MFLIPNNMVRTCTNLGADAVLEKPKPPALFLDHSGYFLINGETQKCLHIKDVYQQGREHLVTNDCNYIKINVNQVFHIKKAYGYRQWSIVGNSASIANPRSGVPKCVDSGYEGSTENGLIIVLPC